MAALELYDMLTLSGQIFGCHFLVCQMDIIMLLSQICAAGMRSGHKRALARLCSKRQAQVKAPGK